MRHTEFEISHAHSTSDVNITYYFMQHMNVFSFEMNFYNDFFDFLVFCQS